MEDRQRQTQNGGTPLPVEQGHLTGTAEDQSVSIGLDAEQQRVNQESEAARTSKVFASTTAPTSAPRASSQEAAISAAPSSDETFAQNGQDRKHVDRRTTAPDKLSSPASPFVIQAGTIIPQLSLREFARSVRPIPKEPPTNSWAETPPGRPRRRATLEAAEPFPATRSALQGFAVDACLFTGPKSSTVYQAGAGAALRSLR